MLPTQCGEGEVDLGGFFEALTAGPGLALPLRPGQVNQVKLPHPVNRSG
jgi:hypothetical protein